LAVTSSTSFSVAVTSITSGRCSSPPSPTISVGTSRAVSSAYTEAMSALRRVSTAMSAQFVAGPWVWTSPIWSAIQLTSSFQVSKVAARTWAAGAPGGGSSSPRPSMAPAVPAVWARSGWLNTLARSKIDRPLRRFTVSGKAAAGRPSRRRNPSAKVKMLLAAAPRQP
jgi:hypothetical protein